MLIPELLHVNVNVEWVSLTSPDVCRVELGVNKHYHLKGHGDAQSADAGHHRLEPEHVCRDREECKSCGV